MKIFDSHCHLDDACYAQDLDEVIARARKADVRAMMVVGVTPDSSRRAVEIARLYDPVIASVGIHPHDAKECTPQYMEALRGLAADPKVRAWGETGLDFNRMFSPQKDQEYWFARQLEIGGELNLPMIFHERDSGGRFAQILKTHWGSGRNGVVHCFSGNRAELEEYLALGLYIGITGVITIQSRGVELRRLAAAIPIDRLLVETDAPYLTPTPERNKHRRNEPAFVRTVFFSLADVLGIDPPHLAERIWENSCRLFGWTPPDV